MATNPISQSSQVEFNDSVLSTKAWNSSRYDGRQLQATQLNVARKSDIGNNDRTPILQKYSRNIYIGNEIINLTNGELDDDNLLPFDRFSYVQTNRYITVNDDGTITDNRLEETKSNNNQKIGFYRAFYEDFPQTSDIQLIIADPTVPDNTKPSYNVYFNGGQLKKVFHLDPMKHTGNARSLIYSSGSLNNQDQTVRIYISEQDTSDGMLNFGFATDNTPLLQTFYTRSLVGPGNSTLKTGTSNIEIIDNTFKDVFAAFFEFKANSSYVNDKRLFLSFISGSTGTGKNSNTTINPLILRREENHGGNKEAIRNDLSFVSTCEIDSITFNNVAGTFGSNFVNDEFIFNVSPKNNLSQDYQNLPNHTPVGIASGQTVFGTGGVRPQDPLANRVGGYSSGSIQFSICDDENPSLLLELVKSAELPSGIGDKPFIIIPENIHPYVKDNLTYFLTRAGIDVGDNTSAIVEEKTDKKPPTRPVITAEMMIARRAAFEAERRRNELPKEERRRRRQEKREERRREERRERQERREDRQERRRERRRNRRRRR